LIVCCPWWIHLGFIYTIQLLSFYNSSNRLLSLYNSTSWLQRLYLANFIYLNSSLISTRILTWLGLQSWTLSWLNFSRNSVFKLNQILWSFYWLRLLDWNQLELLIFILLGLDLNWALYLGIFLVSDSFRSPPSTRIDPSYLTRIQLYLLVESGSYKLDIPMYKKVSYRKQRSPLALHIFVLPCLLTRVLTRFLIQTLTRILTRDCYLSRTWNFSRVLPRHIPNWVNPALPEHLSGQVKSYPIVYPTLPEAYPVE
jgi:hypothetical protein